MLSLSYRRGHSRSGSRHHRSSHDRSRPYYVWGKVTKRALGWGGEEVIGYAAEIVPTPDGLTDSRFSFVLFWFTRTLSKEEMMPSCIQHRGNSAAHWWNLRADTYIWRNSTAEPSIGADFSCFMRKKPPFRRFWSNMIVQQSQLWHEK
jgi:hypothetical protein